MESFSGDTEGSTEDIPGRKKSKLKSLKNRLFGRSKRRGGEGDAKLSQSASDITAEKGPGSEEDLACSEGMMGSRALSADSIFLADQVLTDTEPARVLSQENVHSKIKALQIKLQQQKMHLGPPPLVLPVRRAEDLGSRSEDDGLPQSLPEITGALSKTTSQPSSRPLSPILKPAPIISVPLTPSLPLPLTVPSNSSSSVVEPPLDFSSPAQFTPCLDTSAARHRLSLKPRNQRASTRKTIIANDSNELQSDIHVRNNINRPESVREETQHLSTREEQTLETEQGGVAIPITSQRLPSKSPEVAPITSEAVHKSSSQAVSQQDQALLGRVPFAPSQVLRVKPHRPADVRPSEQPHSSFIQSELKDNRDRDFEIQAMSLDKINTLNKAGLTDASCDQLSTNLRSSSVQQQVQSETESTRGIRRPTPGSGSFHLSITAKNQDGERPRSGSFVGVLEHIEATHTTVWGTEDKPPSSTREKEELRGGPFAVGRLRQEGGPHKSSVPWDRKDSLKQVESVTPSQNVTTDTSAAKVEELESNQEVVEEAVEAQEVEDDDGKTAFGVKLRSTSLAMRFRSDSSSTHSSKLPVCEEQCDKLKSQEIGDLRSKDPTPCGFSLPVKHNPLPTVNPHTTATEVKTTSSSPKEVEPSVQEPQPAPQTASSEVSWMSLAMLKTRSLQQLFTSRFPRDLTGAQTAARPQAQVQAEAPTGAQAQTVKLQQSTTPIEAANQPSTDAVKAETVQRSRSQEQSVKPLLMAAQQKTPPVQSSTSREPQTLNQIVEPQSASHPAVQNNPWTTQSPSHSSTQTETSSQFAQGSVTQSLAQFYLSSGQQQPPWSSRGVHTANQLKSTNSVCTTSSVSSPPPGSALGRGEREATMQEKEGAPLSARRAVWGGSVGVGEKASLLEKRAEWTTPPGTKGVELKKAQAEEQISGESPASVKTKPLSQDIKPEGRQGVKLAVSSPTKVPERPQEDKWLRKNVAPSSSPSSSPTMPSALQSMTDSGQPSWMELAKRKSMAWSDKSMD
ncbi:acrosomal protein KIAA1210 [Anarrhichthys ocellatus]|uniref:acrosomal protein KIAA1210 n=1 Tax=Anarrhichthys ocellatus TaxID=433405 RepID=UPI0012EEA140|nr:uncharacterized protein KIAA1211-like homolog [Anarrhichthys ocellatus]XP_031725492.1 uncharacterized protein KIAA1211-like homolog [Anarrhichthys ocellatus]